MQPKWWRRSEIPYDKMWADDPLWLEQLLDGASVHGSVHFAEDSATILHQDLSFEWPAAT